MKIIIVVVYDLSSMSSIRAKAICMVERDGKFLLIDGYDSVKKQRFFVPPGGGVEFGEQSRNTIVREIMEELEQEIINLKLLGVLENIFTQEGIAQHEIVFVWRADFVDENAYALSEMIGHEEDKTYRAIWISQDELKKSDSPPLYPDGLAKLL